MQTAVFDSLCTLLLRLIFLKAIDLKTKDIVLLFLVLHNVIVCKSFQGIHGKLFPFLHKLNATDLFFHGREATNTAPLRGSIHPTPEITIKHNGEINNIKGLRRSLAQNPEFIKFIGWTGSKVELADTIGQYSDTAMLSLYVAFKKTQGMETGDILRALFLPDAAEISLGFVAEGPAFVLVRDGKSTYIVNDAQAQRPIKLMCYE